MNVFLLLFGAWMGHAEPIGMIVLRVLPVLLVGFTVHPDTARSRSQVVPFTKQAHVQSTKFDVLMVVVVQIFSSVQQELLVPKPDLFSVPTEHVC
jgi:hypothetical protein